MGRRGPSGRATASAKAACVQQQPPGADGLMMGDGGRVSDRMSGEPASHIMGHMVVRAAGEAWQDLALFHRPQELQGEPHQMWI